MLSRAMMAAAMDRHKNVSAATQTAIKTGSVEATPIKKQILDLVFK